MKMTLRQKIDKYFKKVLVIIVCGQVLGYFRGNELWWIQLLNSYPYNSYEIQKVVFNLCKNHGS